MFTVLACCADEGPLHLNKTGFMANVRTADLQGGSVTKAAPSTTVANPLGHYFNRNISVAAVEKLQPADPHVQKPSGQNKAALGYYFNKENPQSVQQASKEVRQQPDESKLTRTIADGTTVRQGKGLSSLVQTSVFLHQDQNLTSSSADGSAADIQDAQKPAGRQWPAKNVTVSFKPLTISLNPDDM